MSQMSSHNHIIWSREVPISVSMNLDFIPQKLSEYSHMTGHNFHQTGRTREKSEDERGCQVMLGLPNE